MAKLFKLKSEYQPTGDQPQAITSLVKGLNEGKRKQVLLGATGTGKTFTIANVIEQYNKPTLVFSHNKTLAAQLYNEFKELFPENRVEFFVSNFDYYQPEAYVANKDLYIEKNAVQNEELDMLRMSACNSLLQRRDTIVVASVACIYASSDPKQYQELFYGIKVGDKLERQDFLRKLVALQYHRSEMEERASFKVRGDVIEIVPGYTDAFYIRIELFDEEIERICEIDPLNKTLKNAYKTYTIMPASGYARDNNSMKISCERIEKELEERLLFFKQAGKLLEYERLEKRTRQDLEALREFGMVSGIENYAMHIDLRDFGERPYNLFDYFPDDFLLVIDESHVSLPQIRGMYNGDRARKESLVEHGFRLPSALENRPLRFEEFEAIAAPVIYMSATPGDYELEHMDNKIIEQIIRPTGLLDPIVEVRPSMGQIDDLIDEINDVKQKNQRVMITTLTVQMAEDLTAYLKEQGLAVAYLHHENKTLERSQILVDLRKGIYDVLVGINLLREGLDIPEVSLIAILDADSEGFLRSYRSLVQTIGRAARNADGRVIMYADRITDSMNKAIAETKRRRAIQEAYNTEHQIIPKTIVKPIIEAVSGKENIKQVKRYLGGDNLTNKQKEDLINDLRQQMKKAAQELDFERAAELRDIIFELNE